MIHRWIRGSILNDCFLYSGTTPASRMAVRYSRSMVDLSTPTSADSFNPRYWNSGFVAQSVCRAAWNLHVRLC